MAVIASRSRHLVAVLSCGSASVFALSACDALIGFPDAPRLLDGGADALAPLDSTVVDAHPHVDAGRDARVDAHDARVDARDAGDATRPQPADASCVGVRLDSGCLMTLATDAGAPCSIAVDTTSVYWVAFGSAGTVQKTSKLGGGTTTLATGQNNALRIVIDPLNVYWVNYGTADGGGAVVSVPLGGGVPSTLDAPLHLPLGIAQDKTTLYFTENVVGGGVSSVPIVGGDTALFAEPTDAGEPWAIAASGGTVYWTMENGLTGTVWAAPVLGRPRLLATGPARPWAIAVANGHVFWITMGRDGADSGATPTVMSVSVDGGPPTTLAAQAAGTLYGIAVDDQYVYWTDDMQNLVMKIPLSGGTPTTLAATGADSGPTGIAVDDASVYWTEAYSGKVLKLTPK